MSPSAAVGRPRHNPLLAVLRVITLITVSLLMSAAFLTLRLFHLGSAKRRYAHAIRWTRYWASMVCAVGGIRISVNGRMPDIAAVIAPNHQGYLDIPVIGASMRTFFVSRADVADWPFIGWLFRIGEHITVSRARSRDLLATSKKVKERLENGAPVVIFLEGTSTGGDYLLPFRASLIEPAVAAGASIVPVGLKWASKRGDIELARDVAYWGDHSFAPHAWQVMGLTGISVEVTIGDPISLEGLERKSAAQQAQDAVQELTGLRIGSREEHPSDLSA